MRKRTVLSVAGSFLGISAIILGLGVSAHGATNDGFTAIAPPAITLHGTAATVTTKVTSVPTTKVHYYGVCVRNSTAAGKGANFDFPKKSNISIGSAGTAYSASRTLPKGTYRFWDCIQKVSGGPWIAVTAHTGVTITVGGPTPSPTPTPTRTSPAPSPSPTATNPPPVSGYPKPDHIVIVMEENHNQAQVSAAPYIHSLQTSGANLTQSFAITHPSQPNYFALFSGSTWGATSDGTYNEGAKPNMASQLLAKGETFTGYVESGSPRKHNPWESFSNSQGVEKSLTAFPSDFTKLPRLSWVIPNELNDMHDGSVTRGDSWLKSHLGAYATWAKTHNSILIIDTDEDNRQDNNHILTVIYGDHVKTGNYSQHITHYGVLHTVEALLGLPQIGNSGAPLTGAWN